MRFFSSRAGLATVQVRGLNGQSFVCDSRLEADGDFILIRIPELEIVTQARNPTEVVAMACDCIAVWLDVRPDAFDLEIDEFYPTGRAGAEVGGAR